MARIYKIVCFLLVIIVLSGCATTHKYKRHKPVPCPCETQNRHWDL